MRICFVARTYPTRYFREGAGIDTQELARGLAQRGHDVHVVCTIRKGACGDEMDEGVCVHFVSLQRLRIRRALRMLARMPGLHQFIDVYGGWDLAEFSLGAWLKVRSLHQQQRFDVIQAVDTGGIALFGLLWPKRTIPIVIRGHGFVDPESPGMQWCGARFQYWLERFCLRRADYVLANSSYLCETYRAKFGLDTERVTVLHTGFHIPQPPVTLLDIRQERGWGGNDPVVLYVGRIEYLKGCDILFSAVQRAREHVANLRLVLLGQVQPSFQSSYDEFTARNASWVWHPGNVSSDEVSCVMYQSALLVLPSRKETFGRVLVEAQLHGLSVIGTDIGGIPEIVTHGETGLLVQPGDAEGLSRAIVSLVEDEPCRRHIGELAFASASRRFSLESIVQQQNAFFSSLVAARTCPAVLKQDLS